jgi:hypothetical protein
MALNKIDIFMAKSFQVKLAKIRHPSLIIARSFVPPPLPTSVYLLFRRSGEDLEPTPEADDLNVTDESHLW